MNHQPRTERQTQNRVIALFRDQLGYRYLGDWHQRANNRAIETELLQQNLKARGYSDPQISDAIRQLETAADARRDSLYQTNMRTYQQMRYGIPVQVAAGQPHQTIHLIDWDHPELNDFAIAEEVTLRVGGAERRPDIVLYLNGIAVVVIELKRCSVESAEGIRQLISNQQEEFNKAFFATAQLLIAGNDTQGVRYGTITTDEPNFVAWNATPEAELPVGALLDRPLAELCGKGMLLDFLRNFILFDAGRKKVPRQHQFAGIKAAQERIKKQEGGVIWHTQGSGKSILMVLLTKWLLEHDPNGRVLVITDRDELDRQIEGVMNNAGVIDSNAPSPRITSRKEFTRKLQATTPRLLCALIHKFEPDLSSPPPAVQGTLYVFVDECHRTQGGAMNKQMKRWLPNAMFIGFTGTPLLRKDKQTTRQVFGTYIHTYKFHQAVADNVVLDLKYAARDVPQRLTSQKAIDDWFERKTRGLNNFQKAAVRKRWATMQELMSSKERKERIIASIIDDFAFKPRLNNDRGTAMLVTASIYDACHYFRLFGNTSFGQHCGIITSYEPNLSQIANEPANSNERYKYETYRNHVLNDGESTQAYEEEVQRKFKEEPASMKLVIVVSKLLTGFDAPSCTYIYLDQELRDHTLFQAICRTNRLDGDDKDYGYIVDFKGLFQDVQHSIAIYNSDELDSDEGDGGTNNIAVKNWLEEGKERLDDARQALHYLCQPVPPPQGLEQYLHYFCGNASNPDALAETEQLRISFYKATATLLRAYGAITQDLIEAGYSENEVERVHDEAKFYAETRTAIKHYSGEELDLKPYEADMRHLINTYIQADPAADLGSLNDMTLMELIIETGIHDAIAIRINSQGNLSRNAIAEGIINNVRKTIIRDQLTDPRFYAQMSKLLDDLIAQSRADAAEYEEFLKNAEELAQQLSRKAPAENLPKILDGNLGATVIFNNLVDILGHGKQSVVREESQSELQARARLALRIDQAMQEKAPANWKEEPDGPRGREVSNTLYEFLDQNREATEALFEIIKHSPHY